MREGGRERGEGVRQGEDYEEEKGIAVVHKDTGKGKEHTCNYRHCVHSCTSTYYSVQSRNTTTRSNLECATQMSHIQIHFMKYIKSCFT